VEGHKKNLKKIKKDSESHPLGERLHILFSREDKVSLSEREYANHTHGLTQFI